MQVRRACPRGCPVPRSVARDTEPRSSARRSGPSGGESPEPAMKRTLSRPDACPGVPELLGDRPFTPTQIHNDPLSTQERVRVPRRARGAGESPFSSAFPATRMERLWSLAVATSGNRWQMGTPRKRLQQAKTVATGCDQLPIGAHGKEGVDGSSRSEGLRQKPCKWAYSVACTGEIATPRGYETGTFWDWRALAGTRDMSRRSKGRAPDSRSRRVSRGSGAVRRRWSASVFCPECWERERTGGERASGVRHGRRLATQTYGSFTALGAGQNSNSD